MDPSDDDFAGLTGVGVIGQPEKIPAVDAAAVLEHREGARPEFDRAFKTWDLPRSIEERL
jgi:hypothetical protein